LHVSFVTYHSSVLASSGNDPADRRLAHIIEARHLRSAFSIRGYILDYVGALNRGKFRATPTDSPFRARLREPRARALADHRALELGEAADHLHHHAPCRGRRIDALGQRAEARARYLDALDQVQQVLERSGEPIELPDDHNVSGPELAKHLVEDRPIPSSTRRGLLKHFMAARHCQRARLGGVRLLIALRHARVADEVGFGGHPGPFTNAPDRAKTLRLIPLEALPGYDDGMAHIQGIARDQMLLLPASVDDYVAADNPVRFLEAFVDGLDLASAGFVRVLPRAPGRPGYGSGGFTQTLPLRVPQSGAVEPAGLEAETIRNLEVIWLLRGLRPDFKTIADFRRDNRNAFKAVFRSFVLLCRRLDLFGRELLAVDGTRLKAVNSRERNFTREKLARAAEWNRKLP